VVVFLQVCKDVTNILGIAGVEQFSASINRPNLRYEVQHKAAADEFDHLQAWICDNYPDASAQGIVYCLSRCAVWCCPMGRQLQGVGSIPQALQACGWRAVGVSAVLQLPSLPACVCMCVPTCAVAMLILQQGL
jgi:hypothetical protein